MWILRDGTDEMQTSSASKDTPCDSANGATCNEGALMDAALALTVQCASEVPRIILWN